MSQSLAHRIVEACPPGSYSIAGLLRLLDVVESEDVDTAAVECRAQPRLLLNPKFVAAHAPTREKLMMLVLHELHHVLLGHTRLLRRVTRVDNFVFDAVINGLLCRMFPSPQHTAFLTDYYSERRFPHCLLRPPPGWPRDPRVARGIMGLPEHLRRKAYRVHLRLYARDGATYEEVEEVLPRLIVLASGRGADTDEALAGVPLLGDHSGEGEQELASKSPGLMQALRDLIESWPSPPRPVAGRALGDALREMTAVPTPVRSNRQRLRDLIRAVAEASDRGDRSDVAPDPVPSDSPIPALSRRTAVLAALGMRPLLHPRLLASRRRARTGERVHVYLDVSGSMGDALPALLGAVRDCRTMVSRTLHLFSTVVVDVLVGEALAGRCPTTFGTSIECVAAHMKANRIRRALIVTDGFTGKPVGEHLATLSSARIAVAYIGTHVTAADIGPFACRSCTLSIGERP